MNFMAILTAIVTFFRYLPELVKIFTQVAQLLQDYEDKVAAKQKAKEIANAIEKARDTKDTTDLEKIFGPKSFDITFSKVEEKKSLDLGAPKFDAKLVIENPVKKQVEQFFEDQEPKNPLKEIEKLVLAADVGVQYVEPEKPQVESTSMFSFMGFGGGQSSVGITSTFVNHNKMSGWGRMGSKFFVFFVLISIIGGCKTGAKNEPSYRPKLYAGDSSQGGMYRKQSNELIRYNDPKFDQMVGMSYSTLACVYKTYIQNCKEFKQDAVQCDGIDSNLVKEIVESSK